MGRREEVEESEGEEGSLGGDGGVVVTVRLSAVLFLLTLR